VAFATTDREHVNQHFGSAHSFVIYRVDAKQSALLEVAQFTDREPVDHDDRLATKMDVLDGCLAVYCQAVGGSAIHRLVKRGIQPIKVAENTRIDDLLRELKAELQAGPSTWLSKAIQRHTAAANRFAQLEAEGWQE
jgi:nitrogen fixation protein NifX